MTMVRQDIKRAFISWGFLISVTVYTAILFYEVWFDYAHAVYGHMETITLFMYANSVSYMVLVLPILAALPYATSFVQDHNSRYIQAIWFRVRPVRYCLSKAVACFLSGGACLGVSALIFFLFFGLSPSTTMIHADTALRYAADGGLDALIVIPHVGPYLYCLGRIVALTLYGGTCALMAMAASTYIVNAYISLCLPFVAIRMWIYFIGRLKLPSYVNFAYMASGAIDGHMWETGRVIATVIVTFTGLSIAFATIFLAGVKRRYAHA